MVVGRVVAALINSNKKWIISSLSILFTIFATLVNFRLIRVSFDSEDWVHKWENGAFVYYKPTYRPLHHLNVSIPLFTAAYTPNPGDVVVDLGAGDGTEIQYFSRRVGPSGQVVAIEADRDAVRRLGKLVQMLNLSNVRIINKAAGAASGSASLVKIGESGVGNRIDFETKDKDNHFEVEVATLSDILDSLEIKLVNFLKINIEGSEVQALEGLGSNSILNFCISCHDFLGPKFVGIHQKITDILVGLQIEILPNPWDKDDGYKSFYIFARK